MGLSTQEHWSGLPCPPLGDLLNPEIKPSSLVTPALARGFSTTSTSWEACELLKVVKLTETKRWNGGCQGLERIIRSYCLMGTELQFGKMKKFWRWIMVMVVEDCEHS